MSKQQSAEATKLPAEPTIVTTKSSRSGEKVTVACKLPNGLVLRTHTWTEEDEPVFGGGVRKRRVARPTGEQIVIAGTAYPFGEQPKTLIVGGYALTPDVDADFWELWLEQNKKSDIVTKDQIKAFAKPDTASGWAKEHAATRSGLEPINPATIKKDGREIPADPRMPRGGTNITGVVTEARPAG